MPTNRPRHVITETDAMARILDDAAERWPQDRTKRSRLLLHLVEEGHRHLGEDLEAARQRRRGRIAQTSGALSGSYEQGYLERLREDWPE